MEEKKNYLEFQKNRYLDSSDLVQNFKKSYLASLQVILDDQKFKEKADTLPLLKSSCISRYEKLFAKREIEKQKLLNKQRKINSTEPNIYGITGNSINLKKTNPKSIPIRYIIIDNQLVNLTLNEIEENSEINNKLTDPFSSYFQESNPKIRKKAVDQIINNIFVKQTHFQKDTNEEEYNNNNKKITENNILPKIRKSIPHNMDNQDSENIIKNHEEEDIFYKDLELLESKYKLNTEKDEEIREKYKDAMKIFIEKCESNNIETLGQKIDFFVYLFNKDSSINPRIIQNRNSKINNFNSNMYSSFKKTRRNFRISNLSPRKSGKKLDIFSRRNSVTHSDIKQVYYYEVKSAFKLSEDLIYNNINLLEKYEKELSAKIKSFELVKNNLENSQKLIDKLKLHLINLEISTDKIILRECNITPERFVFLLFKKYFDFSKLKQLNLSKNNLGDIGGSYVLFLVARYGLTIEFLNLGYNSLGKSSCEILVDSLSNNNLRISSISIAGNKLGDKLFSEIAIGISKNIFLNKIFIGDNNLGKISAVVIGSILKYDKKIKLIDVSKNFFGDEIIGYILKGLIVNNTLEFLILNDLGLTNKSFRAFATTLVINTTLKQLFLERNKLNYKASNMLSDILNNNRHIEYISLVGNNFQIEHINYIIEQQRQVKLKVISKSDYFTQTSSIGDKVNFYEFFD